VYRGINVFKKDQETRTNIVNDENVDWVLDSYSIVPRWRNISSKLFNVHGVNDVRHTEIHTVEPQVPEPSIFVFKLVIEKLISHKSPGIGQLTADLIKEVVEHFDIRSPNLFILFGIRKNFLRSGCSQSLFISIRKAIKQNVVTTGPHHLCQLRTKYFQCPAVKINSTCRENYCGSTMWIKT
jgi:hypothetical protein